MKKLLACCLALPLLYSVAQATTISGSAVGAWQNQQVLPYNVWHINNNDSNSPAATAVSVFDWGLDNPPSSTINSFTFDGIDSFSVDEGVTFLLGDFSYLNGNSIAWSAAGVTGVDLAMQFGITSPVFSSNAGSAVFNFAIENTPNNTGNNITDGDIVRIIGSSSSFSFINEGVRYSLEILGFSTNGGQTTTLNFSSPEYGTAPAGLYAKFNANPVPEPATLILFGAGIAGLAARRFKNHKK